MHHPSSSFVLGAITFTAVCAVLVATPLPSRAAAPDGAIVVHGTGRMRASGGRAWSDAKPGKVLDVGTTVEASGEDPMDLSLPDGVLVTLEPGATGQWQSPGRLPTEHNGWARGFHLELLSGEIDVRVPADPPGDRAFLVSTTAGTLTDWRGSVHLFVQGNTTAAAIYEGALVIGSNGEGFPVFTPSGIVIKKGSNPERSRGIPVAPTWAEASPSEVPPFAFVRAGGVAKVGVAWAASEGASSYRIEFARDEQMTQVFLRKTTTATSYSIDEPQPPAGMYYARVRTVAEGGIVGNWSKPRSMRVRRVAYPAGSVIARDGAIMLSPGTFVSVSEFGTLEAAFQNFTGSPPNPPLPLVWMKAPSELEMGEEGTRVVHLRDPSYPAIEYRFVLGRRQLKATVDVCPRRAKWPGDAINVRVVLEDPSGRLDLANEPVTFETTVVGGVIPVEWRHQGATWYARIPPQQMISSPPYMVSVVAHDATGLELGSGFLEVDGRDASARAP